MDKMQWLKFINTLLNDDHGISEEAWISFTELAPSDVVQLVRPTVKCTEGRYYVPKDLQGVMEFAAQQCPRCGKVHPSLDDMAYCNCR